MSFKNWPYVLVGSLVSTLAYLFYIKRKYGFLRKYGYDGPEPKFLLGNLVEFASSNNEETGQQTSANANKPPVPNFSKTLQRWTKTYGKIYGYYEGHSPVIVLADSDLVAEVFLNQNKLLSYRRSFPMSKKSNDPNADVFTSNGIRWLRIRYGLEKVMLNSKNNARCLDYFDEAFLNTFKRQKKLKKPIWKFDIYKQIQLLMVQAMFKIIFGRNLNKFMSDVSVAEDNAKKKASKSTSRSNLDDSDLTYTVQIAHKFGDAFHDFEAFSLLKFVAILFPEFEFVWRLLADLKSYVPVSYFADPMAWFYDNFINKHLILFADTHSPESAASADLFSFERPDTVRSRSIRLQSQSQQLFDAKFNYFNSFLYLACNPIMRYNEHLLNRKSTGINANQPRHKRGYSVRNEKISSVSSSLHERTKSLSSNVSLNSLGSSASGGSEKKTRHYSTENWLLKQKDSENDSSSSNSKIVDLESDDFENWKFTINEALNNTLLMFFAGFETTSSAIAFCCHVLSTLPEQREKLLEEMRENWDVLSYNLEKFKTNRVHKVSFNLRDKRPSEENSMDEEEEDELGDDFDDDDVFIDNDKESNGWHSTSDGWNELYDALEKMKYLDMFVKEVLRMFPIASTMVSRKCVVDDLKIDSGNYFIPKGVNVVVDVLSIHYDPVIWGPVDPNIFYPERFLTQRSSTAWLPFGVGCRKCLGAKLATSQIKLFIVRLLQNFTIDRPKSQQRSATQPVDTTSQPTNMCDSILTKEILFNCPVNGVPVFIEPTSNLPPKDIKS